MGVIFVVLSLLQLLLTDRDAAALGFMTGGVLAAVFGGILWIRRRQRERAGPGSR